jgi:hypothetical protein
MALLENLGITAIGAIVLIMVASSFLDKEMSKQLIWYVLLAIAPLFFISLIVCFDCAVIHPREAFENDNPSTESDPLQTLFQGIGAAEDAVCKLVTRTDEFIQGDVGNPGIQNPSLVTDAQNQARLLVGSSITICPATGIPETETLQDADQRLLRLEATLKSFSGPRILKVYQQSVECFVPLNAEIGGPVIVLLQARLTAVQNSIALQQGKMLTAIDAKKEALKRGEASDCDKQKGVAAQAASQAPSS